MGAWRRPAALVSCAAHSLSAPSPRSHQAALLQTHIEDISPAASVPSWGLHFEGGRLFAGSWHSQRCALNGCAGERPCGDHRTMWETRRLGTPPPIAHRRRRHFLRPSLQACPAEMQTAEVLAVLRGAANELRSYESSRPGTPTAAGGGGGGGGAASGQATPPSTTHLLLQISALHKAFLVRACRGGSLQCHERHEDKSLIRSCADRRLRVLCLPPPCPAGPVRGLPGGDVAAAGGEGGAGPRAGLGAAGVRRQARGERGVMREVRARASGEGVSAYCPPGRRFTPRLSSVRAHCPAGRGGAAGGPAPAGGRRRPAGAHPGGAGAAVPRP